MYKTIVNIKNPIGINNDNGTSLVKLTPVFMIAIANLILFHIKSIYIRNKPDIA